MKWLWLSLLALTACGRLGFDFLGDDTNDVDDARFDAVPACVRTCSIALTGGDGMYCDGQVTVTNSQALGAFDMSGRSELLVSGVICDPVGPTVHIGDSPSCDGGGGDNGEFSNDAEVLIEDTALRVYGNDHDPNSPQPLIDEPTVLNASGCNSFAISVYDQKVHVIAPRDIETTSPYLLRLDPPSDSEGVPDSIWYLAIHRQIGNTGAGSGLISANVCW